MRFLRILFAVSLLASFGCDDDSTDPLGAGDGICGRSPDRGEVIAVIGGAGGAGYSGQNDTAVNTGTVINIASATCDHALWINLGMPAALGTATGAEGASAQVETFDGDVSTGVWQANSSQGTVTIDVDTLDAAGATGTFSFSAPSAGSGAVGTKIVDGTFRAVF